ncbi:MAG: CBS domain-containing protein [Saccharothrix sp.]|nr:CBS domain-containing protein [Saccharothrix sp.]
MPEPSVADVMDRRVVTAVPDTGFTEVVGTMTAHGLDAVPVIDHLGRPVGVVTHSDVLAKLEFHGGADPPPLFAGARCRARWHKSSGETAADLMTTPAPTVTGDTTLSTAVGALSSTTVPILCVVDRSGRLIGVLTHHHALRVLVRDDHAIDTELNRDILTPAGIAHHVRVEVHHGCVEVSGSVVLRSTAEQLCQAICRVPGVVAVRDNLDYRVDDLMIPGF